MAGIQASNPWRPEALRVAESRQQGGATSPKALQARTALPTWVETLALIALLSYALTAASAGPLRWGLALAKLTPLTYLPQMLMLLATLVVLVAEAKPGVSPMRAMSLLVLGFSVVVGLVYTQTKQVMFGLYTLLPFWFGLSCGELVLRHWRKVCRVALPLWIMVVLGVCLNSAIKFPWEGFSYAVGDLEVSSSREWESIGGGKRLAGFSRASFDAALQVLLLGVIVCLTVRNLLARLLMWALTFATIYLTTSKGVYNMFIILSPMVLMGPLLPSSALRWWPMALGLIALLMPMAPLALDVNFYIRDQQLANLTYSFWDRLNNMWPEAWKLLEVYGHPLWGRGFGGIGTPQGYFEPERFNAADNIFMYWFVVFGWIALPGFLLILYRSLRLDPWRSQIEAAAFGLLLATLVYGVTANVVESGLFAVSSGLALRYLFRSAS